MSGTTPEMSNPTPRTRETSPPLLLGDQRGVDDQLTFDFYWARTMRNREHKMVKRRTNKKKYRAALAKMKEWIKGARSWPLRMILSSLRLKLRGYWNYYSVIGNSSATWKYYSAIKMLVYKWLNRRSQRKSYRWEKFKELFIGGWNIPAPRVVEQRDAGLQQQSLALPEGSHAS